MQDFGFDFLGLSIDSYLLPGVSECLNVLVASIHHDTVIVDLFNRVDYSDLRPWLPIELFKETGANRSEIVRHCVSKQQSWRCASNVLGVREISFHFINYTSF